MRTSKARTGLRARLACHRRWSVYGKQLPSYTRGGSRMRESRPYGSVRGACDETHVPTATIWIDLGRREWNAVRVTLDGWQIVPNASVPFVRTGTMLPL